MRELTDRQVDLDDLWGPEARHLHERLEATGDDVESRVGLLQSALLARLAAARGIDPMVNSAVDRILTARGRLRVGQLHRALGVGERRLRRRFVAAVGLAPKQLARIARFRGLVSAIERSGAPRWADAALEAGYYDQAHMIADFHELSGQAPTEFLHTARVTTPTP